MEHFGRGEPLAFKCCGFALSLGDVGPPGTFV
jgi:hypothetical protein